MMTDQTIIDDASKQAQSEVVIIDSVATGIMMRGVLRMPYEMAMDSELSRRQFYDRAQQAMDEIESLRTQLSAMQPSKPVAYRQHIEVTKNGVTTKQYGYSDIQIMEGDDALYLVPPSAEVLVEALKSIAEGECRDTHKIGKCLHEKYGYEHCESCYQDFAADALKSYEAKLLHKEG